MAAVPHRNTARTPGQGRRATLQELDPARLSDAGQELMALLRLMRGMRECFERTRAPMNDTHALQADLLREWPGQTAGKLSVPLLPTHELHCRRPRLDRLNQQNGERKMNHQLLNTTVTAKPPDDSDPYICPTIRMELDRQRDDIELIASEDIVSPAVLETPDYGGRECEGRGPGQGRGSGALRAVPALSRTLNGIRPALPGNGGFWRVKITERITS